MVAPPPRYMTAVARPTPARPVTSHPPRQLSAKQEQQRAHKAFLQRAAGSRVSCDVRFEQAPPSSPSSSSTSSSGEGAGSTTGQPASSSSEKAAIIMVGTHSTQATYSLPLEVQLQVLPSPVPLSRRWSTLAGDLPINATVLRSLEVTFEIRTEYYDSPHYAAYRIHRQKHTIFPPSQNGGPFIIPLSNPGQIFRLPHIDVLRIPGWLPSTFELTHCTLTASVSVRAELWTPASSSGLWTSRSSSPSRDKGKTRWSTSTERPVEILRHRIPTRISRLHPGPRLSPSGFPYRQYFLEPEVQSPVECMVYVAESPCDAERWDFFISLGPRPSWVGESFASPRVILIEVGIVQRETYRPVVAQSFTSIFPVPDAEEQPEAGDHLTQSSFPSHASGLGIWTGQGSKVRTKMSRQFRGNNDSVRALELALDIPKDSPFRHRELTIIRPNAESGLVEKTLPTKSTPYLKVVHTLDLKLHLLDPSTDDIMVVPVSIPVRFNQSSSELPPLSTTTTSSNPIFSALPAYVQLFHEGGAPREDRDFLPLYERARPASPLPLLPVPRAADPAVDPPRALPARHSLEFDIPIQIRPLVMREPSTEPRARPVSEAPAAPPAVAPAVPVAA